MAGFISKAKTLYSPTNFMALTIRHRSSSRAATKAQIFEIDTSLSSSAEGEHEMTLKLFDDLIHRILVKKATPDWLPFVPGSSFWVPPRSSPKNVVHLVHKLTDNNHNNEQIQQLDESLSRSSLRGWPSSNYFIKGNAHGGDSGVELNIPEGMDGNVKVKVKVMKFPENLSPEDEEG